MKPVKKKTAKKQPVQKNAKNKTVKQQPAKKTTTKIAKRASTKTLKQKTTTSSKNTAQKNTTKAAKKSAAKPVKTTMAKTAKKSTTKATKKTAVELANKTAANSKPAKRKTVSAAKKKTSNDAVNVSAKKNKANKQKLAPVSPAQIEVEEKAKAIVLNARKRTVTPAMFKSRKNKNTPVVFSMEDVKTIIDQREKSKAEEETEAKKNKSAAAKSKLLKSAQVAKKTVIEKDLPVEHRNHSAASIIDILGFNPAEKSNPLNQEDKVPKKFLKYYRSLLELRNHVSSELDLHTADTLKRSNKDDSGDLSGYGQHMADAGTDTFDRDFALSLVSNEQEALYEIEEAIQRIFSGSYGVCEITNEPIAQERLEAVPFTRYSLEGQKEHERRNRGIMKRSIGGVGVFGDASDETVNFGGEIEDN